MRRCVSQYFLAVPTAPFLTFRPDWNPPFQTNLFFFPNSHEKKKKKGIQIHDVRVCVREISVIVDVIIYSFLMWITFFVYLFIFDFWKMYASVGIGCCVCCLIWRTVRYWSVGASIINRKIIKMSNDWKSFQWPRTELITSPQLVFLFAGERGRNGSISTRGNCNRKEMCFSFNEKKALTPFLVETFFVWRNKTNCRSC